MKLYTKQGDNGTTSLLNGGCELSARLDVARTIACRAERSFWKAGKEYCTDSVALQYINRLSNYLYIEARYADYCDGSDRPVR